MPRFIGIQIPDNLREAIESFRGKYGFYDTEPHISLISSEALGKVPVAQQKLESFCLSQADFRVTISGEPARRGNQVIFLPVVPGLITMLRSRLAAHLGCSLPNIPYRPHVNLVRQHASSGMNFDDIFADASQTFREHYPFDVTQLILFSRDGEEQVFKSSMTIPFTGR